MATQLQIRQNTSTDGATFIGAAAELTADLTNKVLRMHDGVTAGGNVIYPGANPALLATKAAVANTLPVQASNTASSATSCAATTGTFTAPSAGTLVCFADFFAGSGGVLSAVSLTASLSGMATEESVFGVSSGVVRGYLPMTAGQTTTLTATGTASASTSLQTGVFAFFLPGA